MKKQRLNERFQELAGIKPLYEMPKRFYGTAQDRRDEFDPFAHVGSEEEFYTQIQRDMKDIYDLDVPMEEIEKWVAGYHFPYSSWDHEKDEPGPKVLAWETEERIDFIEYLRDKGLAPRPGPESDPPQNYQDAVKSGKYKDMGGNPLKESSISRLKDKVKDMSKEDFTALVKKVGDLDKWKNASKGKFDDGTPIKPFSNASDRIEVIDNNFEEKDAEKYLD